MTTDNLTYTVNTDGSVTIELDNKKVKFVKESDLGAVKVQLKDKVDEVTKLQTDLAGATTKYETAHQEVLQERTAKGQLEKDAQEAGTLKTKMEELTTELAGLKTSSGETATKLTERLRNQLMTQYKITEDKLKDKALTDLETMESTLQLTGVATVPANYDGKGGAGGSGADDLKGKSPLALATIGYEQSNKK